MKDFIIRAFELFLCVGVFFFILWDLPTTNKLEISLVLAMFYRELIDISNNLNKKS